MFERSRSERGVGSHNQSLDSDRSERAAPERAGGRRIDLFRAMYLAGINDPALLGKLIEVAPRHAPEDFYTLVQQRTVANSDNERVRTSVGGQLAAFADRLAAILVIAPEAEQPLHRIVETATALLRKVQTLTVVT